ncbi:unnamed protein product [Mytilus edulis]|uniref:Uncharacterized protein n=1 Tax=Mytilus edulis TaxID=6550 RepID=A0A8S3R0M5_MYTED|nr:unnamed protein product [Mytilus edulis]
MSNAKLVKFINKTTSPPTTPKKYTPVILTDSKGNWLKQKVNPTNQVEHTIKWWSKSGANGKDRYKWLENNIRQKINDLGPIWLYIWFSTCDLTTYNKGYIAITAHGTDAIDNTMQYYHKCIELIQTFDNCRVTILDTPVYSIYHWNKGKHKTPDNFITQDKELTEQVVQLNNKIKEINSTLNSHTPKFSNDLQVRSKYKNGAHRTETNRSYYNFQLYADGIHPTNLLARTWLKKIATQAQIDCW